MDKREEQKEWMRKFLIELGRRGERISYEDLAARCTIFPMSAHDSRLFKMLDDIHEEEHEAGRPTPTVNVVVKGTDYPSGIRDNSGFWIPAQNHHGMMSYERKLEWMKEERDSLRRS